MMERLYICNKLTSYKKGEDAMQDARNADPKQPLSWTMPPMSAARKHQAKGLLVYTHWFSLAVCPIVVLLVLPVVLGDATSWGKGCQTSGDCKGKLNCIDNICKHDLNVKTSRAEMSYVRRLSVASTSPSTRTLIGPEPKEITTQPSDPMPIPNTNQNPPILNPSSSPLLVPSVTLSMFFLLSMTVILAV
eukprot:c14195_g1_i1 orf=15-584(+)